MGIGITQYRACIGIFNQVRTLQKSLSHFSVSYWCLLFFLCSIVVQIVNIFSRHGVALQLLYLIYALNILVMSGDIETNPGPVNNPTNSLSICHWNLNSVWVDDFTKLAQLEVYLALHKFDIVCLSETFLDSSISSDDPRIALEGYNLLRCDHPRNEKKGGVCMYYKDHLPITGKPSFTHLNECLVCELQVGNKKCLSITGVLAEYMKKNAETRLVSMKYFRDSQSI